MFRTTVRKDSLKGKTKIKKQKFEFKAYHLGKIKGSLRRVDIYEDI